jgi:NADH:ubiquinone oxidoreductase subunit H
VASVTVVDTRLKLMKIMFQKIYIKMCVVLGVTFLVWLKRKYAALLVGRSRDRSPVVSLGIFFEVTDGTICPGVDSTSKNEYQENSWG